MSESVYTMTLFKELPPQTIESFLESTTGKGMAHYYTPSIYSSKERAVSELSSETMKIHQAMYPYVVIERIETYTFFGETGEQDWYQAIEGSYTKIKHPQSQSIGTWGLS